MQEEKLAQLRQQCTAYPIDGYILPSTDEYQSSTTAPYAKRLAYITGFTGSYGIALITHHTALLFTDGRYLTQAQQQVHPSTWHVLSSQKIHTWSDYAPDIKTLGYDPSLFTASTIEPFTTVTLHPISPNLVDRLWKAQPAKPATQAYIYNTAGETLAQKLAQVNTHMQALQATHYLLTDPAAICWLLNLRASDIEYTPVLLSYLLIEQNTPELPILYLYTNSTSIPPAVQQHLAPYVQLQEEQALYERLATLTGNVLTNEQLPLVFAQALQTNTTVIQPKQDPCAALKSRKHPSEIAAAQQAHRVDAVAVCEWLAWLAEQLLHNLPHTEYTLQEQLTYFRSLQPGYITNSFPTICGFKENSAIIHYTPLASSAQRIVGAGILLIDSGAHYWGGTTDVTRTLPIGNPTALQRLRYTQVLKGHISIATATFPCGTSGHPLDSWARRYLWQEGLDYPHSTGHGVGNALHVHEAPPTMGPKPTAVALEEGMILSNEPGYYQPNAYGIRIENLLWVKPAPHAGFLQFENLTLVPYCKDLLQDDLLTPEEHTYIQQYYTQITSQVRPLLSPQAAHWLDRQIDLN